MTVLHDPERIAYKATNFSPARNNVSPLRRRTWVVTSPWNECIASDSSPPVTQCCCRPQVEHCGVVRLTSRRKLYGREAGFRGERNVDKFDTTTASIASLPRVENRCTNVVVASSQDRQSRP